MVTSGCVDHTPLPPHPLSSQLTHTLLGSSLRRFQYTEDVVYHLIFLLFVRCSTLKTRSILEVVDMHSTRLVHIPLCKDCIIIKTMPLCHEISCPARADEIYPPSEQIQAHLFLVLDPGPAFFRIADPGYVILSSLLVRLLLLASSSILSLYRPSPSFSVLSMYLPVCNQYWAGLCYFPCN